MGGPQFPADAVEVALRYLRSVPQPFKPMHFYIAAERALNKRRAGEGLRLRLLREGKVFVRSMKRKPSGRVFHSYEVTPEL